MVIQQLPSTGEWSEVKATAPKQEKPPPKPKKIGRLSVVGMQSIACGVLLLLALLLRLAGGDAYEQLRQRLHAQLMRNDLAAVLAELWDGDEDASAVPPLATGTVTSRYGYRGEQFHHGVDIAAPTGTAISAMYDGTVSTVGENDSFGRYVRLSHEGDREVLYAHCSAILVAEGAAVQAGDAVALVGSTGDASGSHVHIQVSEGGAVCDPAATVPLERYA